MGAVSSFLDPSFVVLTDTSLSMYPAAELNIPTQNGFIANAVWQAIGYSPAAALGVGIAELPASSSDTSARNRRPLVICGDGGFQMTAQALSSLKRTGLNAIVIVIDNGLYAIEQFVVESLRGITPSDENSFFNNASVASVPYLAVEQWNYVELAKAMGVVFARKVTSVSDLNAALAAAKNASGPALISASVWRRDVPSELRPT